MKDASTMLKEVTRRQSGRQVKWQSLTSPQWFVLSAGGILAFAGANNLVDVFGNSQDLNLQDPLLGIPLRGFLGLAGTVELLIAWLCLFTNKKTLSLRLVAWLVINFIVYRCGLWTMGWRHPWIFIGGLTDTLNISPVLADCILFQVYLYLLAGSFFLLLRPQSKLVAELRLMAPEQIAYFKVHCTTCGGKTAFDAQWIGQTIPCPHCGSPLPLDKQD